MRLLLVALSLSSGCAPKPGVIPEVRLATVFGTFAHTAIPLAQSLGYFEHEGVRVTLSAMPGSAKVMEAMLGGSADVGASALEHVAQLVAEGRQLRGFVMELSRPPFVYVVSPKASNRINKIDDLRGTTVGVTSVGSQSHLVLNYIVSQHGIPHDAVKTVSIGFGGSNTASIENGKVDAGVTSPSGLELLRRRHPDLRILFDPLDAERSREIFGSGSYPSIILCARTEWLEQNPETARKVARAVVRGLQYLHSHPAAESLSKLPPEQRGPDPEADAAALERWLPFFSTDGSFPDGGYDAILRVTSHSIESVRRANIDPRTLYTNDFVKTPPTGGNR